MKYLIQWNFENKCNRYWSGFGSGYTTKKEDARVFNNMKSAEIESDKVIKSRKQGASIRPCL